jgi:mTERF domain-containing protein
MRESGFTEDQVRKVITKSPFILDLRADRQLKPKIEFLKTLCLTLQDSADVLIEDQVRKMITRTPGILAVSTERQLKPKIEFMNTLGLTAQDIGHALSLAPSLLCCSLEKTLRPNIQYLQNLFGSEAYVSKVFKQAPGILVNSKGPDYLEKKMNHLVSFGLLEDEIKDLVRRTPRILIVSMEKVQTNMDFFIHTAGLPVNFLLTHPQIVYFSLEGRIKPRHKVLKSISAMQPSNRLPSLASAIFLTEGKFLEKYVKCSPHATKLHEIYNGKPVDLDVIP